MILSGPVVPLWGCPMTCGASLAFSELCLRRFFLAVIWTRKLCRPPLPDLVICSRFPAHGYWRNGAGNCARPGRQLGCCGLHYSVSAFWRPFFQTILHCNSCHCHCMFIIVAVPVCLYRSTPPWIKRYWIYTVYAIIVVFSLPFY
jgi:hypothetical protein